MQKMTGCGLKPTQRYTSFLGLCWSYTTIYQLNATYNSFSLFISIVRKAVLGERRVWQTAEDT